MTCTIARAHSRTHEFCAKVASFRLPGYPHAERLVDLNFQRWEKQIYEKHSVMKCLTPPRP